MAEAMDAGVATATRAKAVAKDGKRTAEEPPHAYVLALLLWPCICALPLFFNSARGEPSLDWLRRLSENWEGEQWPSPVGLTLGILAVLVGMIFVIVYHGLRWHGWLGPLVPVQREGAPQYAFWEGVGTHLGQLEGLVMLGGYLTATWMLNLMPRSYYSFDGGIEWKLVAAQLLLQDGFQYAMHWLEHKLSPVLYRLSHKPHHRFTNPRLFDAFNGSLADTLLMILVPLFATAHVVHCNVWSYMTFGTLYANWLTLVHSEWSHPWDPIFRKIGFGTAADHHVHHKLFVFNYGHLFMYWDRAFGTYRDPDKVSVFNEGV